MAAFDDDLMEGYALTANEARSFLASCNIRRHSDAHSMAGSAFQISHEGRWFDLCRGDDCGQVVSYVCCGAGQIDRMRQELIEGVLCGVRIEGDSFVVVDSATDG